MSSKLDVSEVRLHRFNLIWKFLLLKDITNFLKINRVSLVEVGFFLQVSQHNVHLPVRDHQTKDVVFDIINLFDDFTLAVIDALLVST